MISVIIPVLNEEIALPSTLRALTSAPGPIETIIVDGGSTDRSVDIASSVGCRVISAPRGRARQMNAGAAEARGDWLMFLHADTHLHPDAFAAVHALGDDPQQLAGGFHHRFNPSNLRLDLISWINNRRCAHTRVFYGDQAPFVRRSAFRQLGGFPEVSMLEDVLFMEALNRITRPRLMPQAAITDARRFNQHGVVRSFGRVFVILSYHKLGWRIPARKFFAEVR